MSGGGMCSTEYPQKDSDEYRFAMTFHGEIGYDLFIKSAKVEKSALTVTFQNNGPAPYYYDWEVVAYFTSSDDPTYQKEERSRLAFIQVNGTYDIAFPIPSGKRPNSLNLSVKVINPLSEKSANYLPVMLSNENCRDDGTVDIGSVKL